MLVRAATAVAFTLVSVCTKAIAANDVEEELPSQSVQCVSCSSSSRRNSIFRSEPKQGESSGMWPYPTYKPISWDKYYAHDMHDRHMSLTSGLAAAITIGVFFAVFLLTFGCRLYSQRHESSRQSSSSRSSSTSSLQRRLSVSDFFRCGIVPRCPPPPPYDVAVRIPPPGEPPPFTETPETSSVCCLHPHNAHHSPSQVHLC